MAARVLSNEYLKKAPLLTGAQLGETLLRGNKARAIT